LAQWGIVATCNAGGANKGRPAHRTRLRGHDVCILPDSDDAGRKHGAVVATTIHGVASRVRVVGLPRVAPQQDVVDSINVGHSSEQFDALLEHAAEWKVRDEDASPRGNKDHSYLQSICAANTKMRAIDWLWPDRFALGKIGLIVGLPDLGKGQTL